MKSPGRRIAEWVVADPHRTTLTPKTDLAFYTFMYNIALALLAVAIGVVTVAIGVVIWAVAGS